MMIHEIVKDLHRISEGLEAGVAISSSFPSAVKPLLSVNEFDDN
jgi:hypothetical protein